MNNSMMINGETKVRRKLNFLGTSPVQQFVNFNIKIQEKRKNNDRIEFANCLQFKAPKRQKVHPMSSNVDMDVSC